MRFPKLILGRDFPIWPIIKRITSNKGLVERVAKIKDKTLSEAKEYTEKKSLKYLLNMVGGENPGLKDCLRKPIKLLYLNGFFKNIKVDEKSIEKIKDAQNEGSVLFLPPHYSMLDFVSETWIFDKYNIKHPYIAAGSNIWPSKFYLLDLFIRSFRGFPIDRKRTKKKDILYLTTLKEFTKEILGQGHNLLLYLDGGRRKNGEPNIPKTGELKSVIEYQKENPEKKIFIAPVPVSYDRIPEDNEMVNERLTGLSKYNTSDMFRIPFLPSYNRRCGELSIKFNEPYLLSDYLNQEENRKGARATQGKRLADRVIEDIENSKEVMDTQLIAAEIAECPEKRVLKECLIEKIQKIKGIKDIRVARKMLDDVERIYSTGGFIRKYTEKGKDWWEIKKSNMLSFYKNQVVNKYRNGKN